ncbi:MAG: cofactor-independent phosphoglycerate mutase [Clostridia bacterium]|nr:cofactor-independent phosphoglycerate mutase [Clostridia bacterium]
MKYIVLLCDGMADYPVPELGNKTPMDAANKPAMDKLSPLSELGMMKTVPEGLPAGSDVANLSVIGYNPADCYTGRSPLEAANLGVDMTEDDVALRCNLVTLSEEPDYAAKTMLDYCAGDISTGEARALIESMQAAFGGGEFDFYTGTAYRHCLIWHGGKTALGKITPPHDISGRVVGEYLPTDPAAAPLLDMMQKSVELFRDHPVNIARREKGLRPATSVWFWGQGSRPQLRNFEEKYGLRGAMISAVDLLKGIGRLTGMKVCLVDGATGYLDTNFEGKRDAALAALRDGCDYAYIHLEAPDECGHRGEIANKVKSIEAIDSRILAPMLEELRKMGDFTLLICPDHPTPLSTRTHARDPIPYLLYRSDRPLSGGPARFTEQTAAGTGLYLPAAHEMLSRMMND